jgi:chromosome segregation ATPase
LVPLHSSEQLLEASREQQEKMRECNHINETIQLLVRSRAEAMESVSAVTEQLNQLVPAHQKGISMQEEALLERITDRKERIKEIYAYKRELAGREGQYKEAKSQLKEFQDRLDDAKSQLAQSGDAR